MYCNSCGKQNPDDSKFCSNCGKPTRGNPVELSTTAHKSVIREVKINFKLPNGSYPSASQYYKMFSNWQSEWEWNPSHIELKTMREILIKTINKWIESGWELIDTIDDDLLLKDHYKDETPMSKLGSFLRTNWDYTYKQTWTYYGARFHIKSTPEVEQIPENTTISINGSDLDPAIFGINELSVTGSTIDDEAQHDVGTARILHDFLYLNLSCSKCGFKGFAQNTSICPNCNRKFV